MTHFKLTAPTSQYGNPIVEGWTWHDEWEDAQMTQMELILAGMHEPMDSEPSLIRGTFGAIYDAHQTTEGLSDGDIITYDGGPWETWRGTIEMRPFQMRVESYHVMLDDETEAWLKD